MGISEWYLRSRGILAIVNARRAKKELVTSRGDGGWAVPEFQRVCDPVEKPGVQAFRRIVLQRFGGVDLGIGRACDKPGQSEHKEGRAWDWGWKWSPRPTVGEVKAWVDAKARFFAWLFGDGGRIAKRAGVMMVISDGRIWYSRDIVGGAKPRKGRVWLVYGGADAHTYHVHLSFSWAGARGGLSRG